MLLRPNDDEIEVRSLSFVERVGLLGSILSTVGETLGTMADIMALEESLVDELEQQQKIDDLQKQIDEIRADMEKD